MSPIAKRFARQKLLFQLCALGLFAFMLLAIWLGRALPKGYVVAFVTVGFFGGYWVLGRTFWRCPACGARLSFTSRYLDRQSINSCPGCHATLQ